MTSVRDRVSVRIGSVAAALLLLAGCALFGDDGDTAAEDGYASFSVSCSPVDGAALEIFLTARQTSCDTLSTFRLFGEQTRSFTHLLLYGVDEPVSQPYALGREIEAGPGYSTGGWGTRCEAGDACKTLERGSVVFKPSADDEQVVEVSLFFEDGTRDTGQYAAQECKRVVLCG